MAECVTLYTQADEFIRAINLPSIASDASERLRAPDLYVDFEYPSTGRYMQGSLTPTGAGLTHACVRNPVITINPGSPTQDFFKKPGFFA